MIVSDNFNRANETPIAAPWVKAFGADFNLVSNAVQGTTSANSLWYYSGSASSADQFSEATMASAVPGNDWGPAVRVGGAGDQDCYFFDQYNGAGGGLSKFVAGLFSTITTGGSPIATGDSQRIEVEGSALRGYVNGTQTHSATDTSIAGQGDGAGLFIYEAGGAIDNWSGGDLPISALTSDQLNDPESLGIAQQYQRGSFTAAGRRWQFYSDGLGTASAPQMVFSSTDDDGATWEYPTIIGALDTGGVAVGSGYFDVHFDGTFVHYARGEIDFGSGAALRYRRGTPNADGSITWSAAEQTILSAQPSLLECSITVDDTGHAWIVYERNVQDVYVVKNANTNGTWSTTGGYPLLLSSETLHWWTWVGNLGGGAIAVVYYTDDYTLTINGNTIFCRVFDGSSWGTEELVDLDLFAVKNDNVSTNIAALTDESTGQFWIAWGDTATGITINTERLGTDSYNQENVSFTAMDGLALGLDTSSGEVHMIGKFGGDSETLAHFLRAAGGGWSQQTDILPAGTGIGVHPGGFQISERDYGSELLVSVQHITGALSEPLEMFAIATGGGGGPWFINIGRVTETDTARVLTRVKTKSIVRVTEAETARALTHFHGRTLTRITETDTVRTLTWKKVKAVARITETDTARTLTRLKTRAINRVTEADTARTISRLKTLLLGKVTETDAARGITGSGAKQIAVARVTENDSARTLAAAKVKAVARVTENNVAQTLTRLKQRAINRVAETDTARPIFNKLKALLLGRVSETDTARGVNPAGNKLINLTRVTEADSVRVLTRLKTEPLGRVVETDVARGITFTKVSTISRVIEIDTAQVLGRIHTRQLTRVAETDTVRSLSFILTHRINTVLELDTARPIVGVLKSTLGGPSHRTGTIGRAGERGGIARTTSGSIKREGYRGSVR